VQAVLDEEIQHLSAPLRQAFVLCVLGGKSGAEAAGELGCNEGAVKTRVHRARRLLQHRLARRGIQLSVLLAALSVAESAGRAALPTALCRLTVHSGLLVAAGRSAAGVISPQVAALAAGVTRAMLLTKIRIATAVLLGAGVLAGALWAQQAAPPRDVERPPAQPSSPTPAGVAEKARELPAPTCTYKGRVLDPDGKPVAGAKLYFALPPETEKVPIVRATTGADGRFQFTATRQEFDKALPQKIPAQVDIFASMQVVAVADGYAPDWTPIAPKRPTGELTFRLARNDVTINGRILDLQGKPVAGAKVKVERVETTREDNLAGFLKSWKAIGNGHFVTGELTKVLFQPRLAGLPAIVTTGADGRFRLPGAGSERILLLSIAAPQIEHSTFRVLARPEAEVKALSRPVSEAMMRRGELPPLTAYGATFEHLALPARLITGVVRDKETGKPMKGVRVSGHAVDPYQDTHPETYTDADGRYHLRGLPKAGKYRLFFWPGDFSTYIPGGREISGAEGTATVKADFEMIRGIEVRGRITDKVTGKPVVAGVTYSPLQKNTHPGAEYFRLCSKNCEGILPGTFREMVPPGPGVFMVRVRGADYDDNPYTQVHVDQAEKNKYGLNEFTMFGTNAYRVVDVPANVKSITCDIQVDPGRSVTGKVLGPDGKPLAGALVRGLNAISQKATTLKSATFKAIALNGREPREIYFVHVKRKLAGKLTVRGDEKGEVTVRLQPWGALTGRIVDEDGRPMAGVRIQMSFLDPMFYKPVTWWVSSQGEEVKTDRDGRFRADGLTPDVPFRLSASSDRQLFLALTGTPDGMRQLSVGAGQTRDLGVLKAKAN
jgi:protocatechuate 3,4-dioxygenase beta subunit